ncbi:MAG: universal stress protein [Alphaproteobacteria bacterium]
MSEVTDPRWTCGTPLSKPGGTRLLAIVDVGEGGAVVARRAVEMACASGGSVVIAHVVTCTPGYETDHWPFLTPVEMETELLKLARRRLDDLLRRCGLGGIQRRVVAGDPLEAVGELAAALRTDAVIAGTHAPFGLDRRGRLPAVLSQCEIYMVPTDGWWREQVERTLSHALSSAATWVATWRRRGSMAGTQTSPQQAR